MLAVRGGDGTAVGGSHMHRGKRTTSAGDTAQAGPRCRDKHRTGWTWGCVPGSTRPEQEQFTQAVQWSLGRLVSAEFLRKADGKLWGTGLGETKPKRSHRCESCHCFLKSGDRMAVS